MTQKFLMFWSEGSPWIGKSLLAIYRFIDVGQLKEVLITQ